MSELSDIQKGGFIPKTHLELLTEDGIKIEKLQSTIDKQAERIKELEDIIGYAIGGIDALLSDNEDALAVKETLEQSFEVQDGKD